VAIDRAKRVIEPWQIAESTWLLRSGFMDVRRDFALDLKDFCEVVAVTHRLEILLVREYKHGARAVMRTLPAGFYSAPAHSAPGPERG